MLDRAIPGDGSAPALSRYQALIKHLGRCKNLSVKSHQEEPAVDNLPARYRSVVQPRGKDRPSAEQLRKRLEPVLARMGFRLVTVEELERQQRERAGPSPAKGTGPRQGAKGGV
jgi:hypothetical protein